MELEFGNVGFYGGRKTGEPGEKPSKQGREPTTNSTHIWHRDRNRTRATLVEGERSQHCAIPAPPNKGEILSCKSIKPCKNRKNSRACYVRTRHKSGSNSLPFQRNVQIPPSPGTMHSQMPGVCPGGCWSFELISAFRVYTKPVDSQHQIVPLMLRNEGKLARERQKNAGRWIANAFSSLSSQAERAKNNPLIWYILI